MHSIFSFFNQLKKSETGGVDVLYSMFREDTIVYEDKRYTNLIRENIDIFKNRNMKSFIGYALGQTKKFGIKGARYGELDIFVTKFLYNLTKNDENNDKKLVLFYDEIKEFFKEQNFKYLGFVMAPKTRGLDANKDAEYCSVLGKLFEDTVTLEYFVDRVKKLKNQFGNRTKTIANTTSKTDFKALSHSLRIGLEVKELLETSFIKFPLKDANKIREIKEGKRDVKRTIDEIQNVLDDVDKLLLKSNLPEKCNDNDINTLLLKLLKQKANK